MRGEPAGPLEQRRLKNRFPGLDASSHRSQPLIGTQESTGSICCHSQIIFCQRRRRNRCCLHPLSFHQRGQARFSRRPWSCCFPKRPSGGAGGYGQLEATPHPEDHLLVPHRSAVVGHVTRRVWGRER